MATNSEFVRQWVHGEHLLFDGKKMAKSAGNVLHVADLIERKIDPLSLRLLFMESHYRTQMNLTWESIEAAHTTLKRWRKKIASWPAGGRVDQSITSALTTFFGDDLNTGSALLLLRQFEKDESISEADRRATFLALEDLLGLELNQMSPTELPSEALALVQARASARENRNWPLSDQLRDQLLELGVRVNDGPEGQTWELI